MMPSPEVITAILAIVGGIAASAAAYARFKAKLKQIREFIDTLDDALYDNEISEKEYRGVWESFKAIFEPKERR